MCAYSPGGPFNALLLAPPQLTFTAQTQCWLLAASHYLSLKARSDRLAFCLCFLDAKIHQRLQFCFFFAYHQGTVSFTAASIFVFFFSVKLLVIGLVKHAARRSIPDTVLHISRLFQWEPRELCNLQALTHGDRNKTPMPHLER